MRFRRPTADGWILRFALLPVVLDDGSWVWLERYEEYSPVRLKPVAPPGRERRAVTPPAPAPLGPPPPKPPKKDF